MYTKYRKALFFKIEVSFIQGFDDKEKGNNF